MRHSLTFVSQLRDIPILSPAPLPNKSFLQCNILLLMFIRTGLVGNTHKKSQFQVEVEAKAEAAVKGPEGFRTNREQR